MPPYITATDMQARYDWKLLGDLVGEGGERVSPVAQITNAKMVTACTDASGEVDTALLFGNRYTSTDLSGLTGNNLNRLKQICCSICICNLYEIKFANKFEMMEPFRKAKEEALERLRTGANIFGLPTTQESATTQATGLSIAEYSQSGLVSHYPGMHYFPTTRPTFGNG